METNAAEKFIFDALTANVALVTKVGTRIFNTRRNGAVPCVLFQLQAPGNDMMMLGGVRVWANLLYLVRGIAQQASYEGDLAIIANAIDTSLHAKSGSNAAGTIWTCVRERPFQMAEVVDGQEFRHLGSIFRIQAR